MKYLSVTGWKEYQHYKDRDPPWIKLYKNLFTTEAWLTGTDLSRLVQVASTLLAARYNNKTPYVWEVIRKVTNLDCTEQAFHAAVEHLVGSKFLEIQQDSDIASNALATCATTSKVLYSETESEGETESESDARERLQLASKQLAAAPRGTLSESEIYENVQGIKAVYPEGAAREDWITAEQHMRRLVDNGEATWTQLDEGVGRYKKLCRATNRTVMNPANFFSAVDKPWSQKWPLPKTKADNRLSTNLSAAEEFMRRTEAQ